MNLSNLPPGCTDAEIERRFGPPRCEDCDRPFEAEDPDETKCESCRAAHQEMRQDAQEDR